MGTRYLHFSQFSLCTSSHPTLKQPHSYFYFEQIELFVVFLPHNVNLFHSIEYIHIEGWHAMHSSNFGLKKAEGRAIVSVCQWTNVCTCVKQFCMHSQFLRFHNSLSSSPLEPHCIWNIAGSVFAQLVFPCLHKIQHLLSQHHPVRF